MPELATARIDRDDEQVIERGRTERRYWCELWRYRELLYILAWRDVAVRYKQTAIGIAWALVQPLAQMLVMVVVFGTIAKLPSDGGAPYALMVFAAMLPWQFFATAISSASLSIAGNAHLIDKVYFPRMIVPIAAMLTSLVDLLIAFAVLAVLMIVYGYPPGWRLLALPLFVAIAIVAALGPALLLTALNARYRDFRHVLPFIVQFGLYVSPVGFSSAVVRDTIGEGWFLVYSLNPMVGVIEGFRWAILGGEAQLHAGTLALSIVLALALLWAGAAYFRRVERTFADVV